MADKEFHWSRSLPAYFALAGFTALLLGPFLGSQPLFGGDAWLQLFPRRIFSITSLQHGILPLWNPYNFCGVPFHAQMLTGWMHPFTWLGFFWPVERAATWSLALHHFLGMAGLAALLRWMGVGSLAAMAGGLLYGANGFVFARMAAGHWMNLATFAYVPWVILLVEKGLASEKWRFRHWGGAALLVALNCAGGHPQYTYYLALAIVLLAGFRLVAVGSASIPAGSTAQARKLTLPAKTGKSALLQKGGSLVFLALLCAGLTAGLILPAAELSDQSVRRDGYGHHALEGSLSWGGLGRLFSPTGPSTKGSLPPEQTEETAFLGVIGLLLLILGFLGAGNKKVLPYAILCLLSVVFALGANLPPGGWLWPHLPGASLFRTPARLLALFTFSAAVLGGWGADWVLRKGGKRGEYALGILVVLHASLAFSWAPAFLQPATRDLGWPALARKVAEAFPAPIRAYWYGETDHIHQNMASGMANPNGYSSGFSYRLNRMVNFAARFPQGTPHVAFLTDEAPWFLDETGAALGISTRPDRPNPDEPSLRLIAQDEGLVLFQRLKARPLLELARVGKVSSTPSDLLTSVVLQNPGEAVLEHPLPEASGTDPAASRVEVRRWEPHRREAMVETAVPRIALLRETFFPGWEAELDGKSVEIFPANGLWQAVRIPSGSHAVAFTYRPVSFRYGLFLSLWTGLLFLAAISRKKKPEREG